ncbi:MAG: TlpA family protein disulfide reductase [Brevinematales bacterium]|nr:TlpA family protein disulfide reductase [Brevinematales bacterium]
MNLKKSIFFLLVVLLLISCTKGKSSETKEKSKPIAYNITGEDIFGNKVELYSFKGRVILLNFWATWCPPCKAEIPDLIKLQNDYKDKLIVFGISVDQDGVEVVKKFYKENKLNYPVVMLTEDILNNYGGVSAIPTSFVINKKGELEGKIVGMRSYDQLVSILKPFMESME